MTAHSHSKRQVVNALASIVILFLIVGPNNNFVSGLVEAIRSGTTGTSGRSNLSWRTSLSLSSPGLCPSSSSSTRSYGTQLFDSPSSSSSSPSPNDSREDEIRKKIQKLKEEGKFKQQASPEGLTLPDDRKSAYDQYADKVQGKLGKKKGQLLGFAGDGIKNWGSKTKSKDDEDEDEDYDIDAFIAEEDKLDAAELKLELELDQPDEDERGRQDGKIDGRGRRVGRIGSLPEDSLPSKQPDTAISSSSSGADEQNQQQQKISINPAMFDVPENDEAELTEEELIELVAKRMAKKRAAEDAEIEAASIARREEKARQKAAEETTTVDEQDEEQSTKKTTTGVGGSWSKNETAPEAELDYTPKVGGWGVFARPKSISEAYGGGRQIGAGFDNTDEEQKLNTQRLLKGYRKKVGIDTPTEGEHAAEIEEALSIGARAMQRGVYGTAVSALEKVTQWCSTNSKVGSKVYLELAMAYEAVGRKKEAAQIYTTLSDCRMEDIKYNAKRLLYGLEAMEVMQEVSSDFSRKKSRNAFIDATGLDNIASNFDDVYATAYVDLDNGFYKKLTESVVRSTKEARQILVKAEGKGEVTRTRIVQALRCIARQYDDLLQSEIESSIIVEPTAFLNGKPIEKGPPESSNYGAKIASFGDFDLLSANEMIQNLDGEWRLQLLADKQGDGVSFFNTTTAVQTFSSEKMTFSASGPSGLIKEQCSGRIEMDNSKRVLSKSEIETSNTGFGGILSKISGGQNSGFSAAVSRKQQIISVDSLLLITRCARGTRKSGDADKEHFGVWRREFPEDDFP